MREAERPGRSSPERSLTIRNARSRALRALDVRESSAALGGVAARLSRFLDRALGPKQQLLEYNVMVTKPGAEDQGFHSDVTNFDTRLASVQISLVDTDAQQGALEVTPGTQRTRYSPP